MKSSLHNAVVLGLLLSSMGAAFAGVTPKPTVFNFSDLMYTPTGATKLWSGSTKPSDGIYCTGGDLCSSAVDGGTRNGDLTYQSGGIQVKATGTYLKKETNGTYTETVAAVVQDHIASGEKTQGGAGLGVYHQSGITSDDNITTGETLKMSFNQTVYLSNFGLRAEGHTANWGTNPGSFQYRSEGMTNWITQTLAANVAPKLTGKVFYFRDVSPNAADQFYLGTMSVTAVPEPESYAMLIAGLGLVASIVRRRKQKAAAA